MHKNGGVSAKTTTPPPENSIFLEVHQGHIENERGKRQRAEEEEEELRDCDQTPLRRACKSDKLEKGTHVLVKPTKGNTPRKMWVMRTDSGRAFIQLCANKTLESGLRGLYKLDEIYLCHCNNKRTRLLAEQ